MVSESTKNSIRTWSTVTLAIVAVVTFILALFTEILPTTTRIREVIIGENKKLLKDTDVCVQKIANESSQGIVTQLVIFRQNPESARRQVYQDAFAQADKNKYIFLLGDGCLTEVIYQKEEWRLLKRGERDIVEKYCERREEDVLTLLDMLLSDYAIAKQLSIDKSYDRDVGPEKEKVTCHITPYDKIGIIGGYIGELKWKGLYKVN